MANHGSTVADICIVGALLASAICIIWVYFVGESTSFLMSYLNSFKMASVTENWL